MLFNYESMEPYLDEMGKIVANETLLVFDEVHKVKAIGGRRAQAAVKLSRYAKYTIALTGTPIPNTYRDIYNLLDILYHDEYQEFFGFQESQLKQPTEEDILDINEKLQPFFCRTTKEQLQVPTANNDITVLTDASQAENELLHILRLKYRNSRLAFIIRVLQLESNPKSMLNKIDPSEFSEILDDTQEVDDIDYVDFSDEALSLISSIKETSKFTACMKLAKELYQAQKPTIIWCIFRNSIAHFQRELEKIGAPTGCIYGDVTHEDRLHIIEQFRNGEIKFLITNPHTLAESVSLHSVCHDAIYFEYSYNLVHLLQSKDRIHRLGLLPEQYTQYYYMQQKFSLNEDGNMNFNLDSAIHFRLKEKEETMLEAIENGKLEQGVTTEEDMKIIFKELGM